MSGTVPSERRSKNDQQRKAFSLIEMIGVMAVMTLLLGVGTAGLIRLQTHARRSGNDTEATLAITDVGRRFRSDAHAASGVISIERDRLQFGGTVAVTYAVEEQWLKRESGGRKTRIAVTGFRLHFDSDQSAGDATPSVVRLVATPLNAGPVAREFAAAVGVLTRDASADRDDGDLPKEEL